jgi:Zn-dependent alcohol dehydrogenase
MLDEPTAALGVAQTRNVLSQIRTLADVVAFGHERRLIASRYGSARICEDFLRLVDLSLNGVLRIDELITSRYTIDEANEDVRARSAGENARAIIVF